MTQKSTRGIEPEAIRARLARAGFPSIRVCSMPPEVVALLEGPVAEAEHGVILDDNVAIVSSRFEWSPQEGPAYCLFERVGLDGWKRLSTYTYLQDEVVVRAVNYLVLRALTDDRRKPWTAPSWTLDPAHRSASASDMNTSSGARETDEQLRQRLASLAPDGGHYTAQELGQASGEQLDALAEAHGTKRYGAEAVMKESFKQTWSISHQDKATEPRLTLSGTVGSSGVVIDVYEPATGYGTAETPSSQASIGIDLAKLREMMTRVDSYDRRVESSASDLGAAVLAAGRELAAARGRVWGGGNGESGGAEEAGRAERAALRALEAWVKAADEGATPRSA